MISHVQVVVLGKAYLEAESGSLPPVGRRRQRLVVEGVNAKRPDPETDQPGHGAVVVLGDDAHLDDLAEKGVAELELADHRRYVIAGSFWLHGAPSTLLPTISPGSIVWGGWMMAPVISGESATYLFLCRRRE